MSFDVLLTPTAESDLERLFDYLLERVQTIEDLDRAQGAIDAITPYSFRKSAQSPAQRELIIPFGGTGYVALYEIVSPLTVAVLAVRHQREEEYH